MYEKWFYWFSFWKVSTFARCCQSHCYCNKKVVLYNCYKKVDIVPSFCIGDVEVVDSMEDQCIDDLVALLYHCNFLGNAHNIEEIQDGINECVNVNSNESEKLIKIYLTILMKF